MIAIILALVPIVSLFVGISGWIIQRTTAHYEGLLAAKDTQIQDLHAELIKSGRGSETSVGDSAPNYLASLESFGARSKALEGRFAEQAAFLESSEGQTVTWSGLVSQVGFHKNKASVTIKSTNMIATTVFPVEFQSRLSALREMDRVTISGNIYSAENPYHIFLNGDELFVDP